MRARSSPASFCGVTNGSACGSLRTTRRTVVPIMRAVRYAPSMRRVAPTSGSVPDRSTSVTVAQVVPDIGIESIATPFAVARPEAPGVGVATQVVPKTSARSPASSRSVTPAFSSPTTTWRGVPAPLPPPATGTTLSFPFVTVTMRVPSVFTRSGSSTPFSWLLVPENEGEDSPSPLAATLVAGDAAFAPGAALGAPLAACERGTAPPTASVA